MNRLARWLITLPCLLPLGSGAADLAERLRGVEHVLLIRHARAPGVGDPPGYALDRCDTQRVLDNDGKAQANRIGEWLRRQGIRQARVYSSVWCRCRQTAEALAFGPVTIEASLGSFFDDPRRAEPQNRQLQQFIARTLPAKGDRALILVTHHVNIRQFTGHDVGAGDLVLARVDGDGRMLDHRVYPSP